MLGAPVAALPAPSPALETGPALRIVPDHGKPRWSEFGDEVLIERGRAGERDALNALLRRYDRRILRVCERVARTTDEAQDLFQETMMAIVRNLAGFRGDASFMTWVFTIARSFAHRERRRERSRERAGAGLRDAMTTQAPALATPNLEHTIDQQRLSTQFQRAIAELAPLDRDVLVARDIEGLTAPEAAQQTGLTVSAVKSRLHRARRQVRAALTAAAVRVGSRSFSSPASGASG